MNLEIDFEIVVQGVTVLRDTLLVNISDDQILDIRPVQDHFEKDLEQDSFQIISKKGSRSRSFSDHLRKKDIDQDPFQITSKQRI